MKTRRKGFTALELLITLAIVAILLATAIPAVKSYSWNLRMRAAMNALQTDLNLARGRAISHNVQTVICPALDSGNCDGLAAWQHGWIVFSDLNNDRQRQATEPLLARTGPTDFVKIHSSQARSYLRFYPNGSSPGSNITILFCDERGTNHAARVIVSNSGRIRTESGLGGSFENCP